MEHYSSNSTLSPTNVNMRKSLVGNRNVKGYRFIRNIDPEYPCPQIYPAPSPASRARAIASPRLATCILL